MMDRVPVWLDVSPVEAEQLAQNRLEASIKDSDLRKANSAMRAARELTPPPASWKQLEIRLAHGEFTYGNAIEDLLSFAEAEPAFVEFWKSRPLIWYGQYERFLPEWQKIIQIAEMRGESALELVRHRWPNFHATVLTMRQKGIGTGMSVAIALGQAGIGVLIETSPMCAWIIERGVWDVVSWWLKGRRKESVNPQILQLHIHYWTARFERAFVRSPFHQTFYRW
jgi:hypothetical protein